MTPDLWTAAGLSPADMKYIFGIAQGVVSPKREEVHEASKPQCTTPRCLPI
jgi:hypothetical protein